MHQIYEKYSDQQPLIGSILNTQMSSLFFYIFLTMSFLRTWAYGRCWNFKSIFVKAFMCQDKKRLNLRCFLAEQSLSFYNFFLQKTQLNLITWWAKSLNNSRLFLEIEEYWLML